MPILLRWSESETPEAITSLQELQTRISQLNLARKRPVMVNVEIRAFDLTLALDGPQSILIVHRACGPGAAPVDEWISRAKAPCEGFTDYFLLDAHHTELPNQSRIPTEVALDAIGVIFESGALPRTIDWDENTF